MKYPTSSGWYELNDTTEYNGGAVRLKPSYITTPEFKAKLDFHRSEVLKDIRRDGGQVDTHTPWTQEQAEKWAKEARLREEINHLVDKAAFDLGFKFALAKASEMIKDRERSEVSRDHERIVAELNARLEKVNAVFKMWVSEVETIDGLRAEVERLKIDNDRQRNGKANLQFDLTTATETIATQKRVLEKLKEHIELLKIDAVDYLARRPEPHANPYTTGSADTYSWVLEKTNEMLAVIEKG